MRRAASESPAGRLSTDRVTERSLDYVRNVTEITVGRPACDYHAGYRWHE